MNDIVKFGGSNLPTNPADLLQGLQHISAGLTGRSGGMPILRLLKHGVFAYGQEDIEPQEGSEWAINPHSIHHGFACWGDGELLGEAMVPLNQPPPNASDLQDYGEPWSPQISFQLQCLNGEDTGVTVLYKGTSIGFRNAAKSIIDQIVLQVQHEPAKYVPVISLELGHYHHKKHGKTFFPVLDVVRWISIDGDKGDDGKAAAADETRDDGDAPEKEKAAKSGTKRRGRAKAAEPEATEADDEETADEVMYGSLTVKQDEPPAKGRRRRRAV
jgi:hypothetical protein